VKNLELEFHRRKIKEKIKGRAGGERKGSNDRM
jgi:hypothetical protein